MGDQEAGHDMSNDVETMLFELLRPKYRAPEWVLLSQVRNATGYQKGPRTADAIAFNTYPSRGLAIHAFEFKKTRADWLRELRNPDKAAEFIGIADYIFVVAASDQIVDEGELPHGWGLFVWNGKKKLVCKHAATCTHPNAPLPDICLERSFVAAVLRAARAQITDEGMLEEVRRLAFEDGKKAAEANPPYALATMKDKYDRLKESVDAFETASGVHLTEWGGANVGAKMKRLDDVEAIEQRVGYAVEQLRRAVDSAGVLAHD